MKIYKIILITTLFFAFYTWLYYNYLYEETYVKFLPNVPYTTYKLEEIKPIERGSYEYLYNQQMPVYSKVMYNIIPITFLLVFPLFLISVFWGIYIFIRYKKYKDVKWVVIQLVLYTSIIYFFLNTEIMD